MQSLKCHDQNFVKNRVGGREVNLNLDNVFKFTVFFFGDYPLAKVDRSAQILMVRPHHPFWGPQTAILDLYLKNTNKIDL